MPKATKRGLKTMGSMLSNCGRWLSGSLAAALMLGLLVLAPASSAAPGDLDLSFGSGGKVVTDFGGSYGGAAAVAVQADGKIVVAGNTGDVYEDRSFAVARYNADGSLDDSFSADGLQTTDVGGGFGSGAYGLAIQPDGKIVVVGVGGGSGGTIVRYTAVGELDTTFSTDGIATVDFPLFDVLAQPDGKVVVGGGNGGNPDGYFGIARFTDSGDLDPTFSSDGLQTVSLTGVWDRAETLALTSDGKIVAGGTTESDWGLVRLNPDGSLDTTFAGDGKQITDFGGTYVDGLDHLADILVQPDGKILGVGTRWSAPTSTLLARYNQDGSLDQGFGQGGVHTITGSEQPSSAAALQANGRIITTGGSDLAGFAVARHDTTGPLDAGFLDDGLGTIPFAGYSASDVALQADGSILVVGGDKDAGSGSDAEFGLVRLQGGEGEPPSAPTNPNPLPGAKAGVKKPPRPDFTAPAVRVLDKRAKLSRERRVAKLRFACPADEASPPCRGSALVTTRARLRAGKSRRLLILGRATFSLGANETGTITLRLNPRRIKLLLKDRKSIRTRLTVRAHDKAGNHFAQGIALRLARA